MIQTHTTSTDITRLWHGILDPNQAVTWYSESQPGCDMIFWIIARLWKVFSCTSCLCSQFAIDIYTVDTCSCWISQDHPWDCCKLAPTMRWSYFQDQYGTCNCGIAKKWSLFWGGRKVKFHCILILKILPWVSFEYMFQGTKLHEL